MYMYTVLQVQYMGSAVNYIAIIIIIIIIIINYY